MRTIVGLFVLPFAALWLFTVKARSMGFANRLWTRAHWVLLAVPPAKSDQTVKRKHGSLVLETGVFIYLSFCG